HSVLAIELQFEVSHRKHGREGHKRDKAMASVPLDGHRMDEAERPYMLKMEKVHYCGSPHGGHKKELSTFAMGMG
ncbi:hypothetical protein L7F22_054902, partial [Adiantum nelumboides]|nr:hypothetical protein [Adiantum nelumboides]